jgi:hypothetical protein
MCAINLTNIEPIYAHFIWDLFEVKSLKWEIILQSKKGSLVRNYLIEQERFLGEKLSYRARKFIDGKLSYKARRVP